MNLIRARVENFKCIEDSGWVDFEQVTSFVGKNESGKTAFLEALRKLNPVDSEGEYIPLEEYPRKRYSRYKERKEDDPDPVVSAEFEISDAAVKLIENQYTDGVIESPTAEVTKNYQNQYHWNLKIDEAEIVDSLVERYTLHNKVEESFERCSTIEELSKKIESSEAEDENIQDLSRDVEELIEQGLSNHIGNEYLIDRMPEFLYFDEYSIMEGDVMLYELRNRKEQNNLTEADETFLSLLSLANFDLDDIGGDIEYEEVNAELEAASNRISDEVFEYWTQGPDLRVEFDDSEEYPNPEANTSNQTKRTVIHVRIYNERHRISLPFDERSQGFVWFFSFMAYFSGIKEQDDNLVLLLDEPGLNLHAKAQYDFIQFINDRLAPEHPVVYTTHSPFMLEPKRLHRARLVEDKRDGEKEGTRVSEDILKSDSDTLFPLQAALGYDLIQTLLLGPECLLVEGKSDMIYLQVMSDVLEEMDRESLSHRWTIIPVNGAGNVPTFVSLFGASDLRLGVLLDDDSQISQRLEEIEDRQLLESENVITIGDIIDGREGDTEDLFSPDFFTELVTDTYRKELKFTKQSPDSVDLDRIENQHPRIAFQTERFFEEMDLNQGNFNHTDPASHLQTNRNIYFDEFDNNTLDNFERLFERMNELLD